MSNAFELQCLFHHWPLEKKLTINMILNIFCLVSG